MRTWGEPTRTDTILIPIIDGEVVTTVEIAPPWLKPPTTVRYHYRHPSRWQRIRRSAFADDLRASARAAFWPSAIGSGLIVGLVLSDIAHTIGLAL